MTMERSEEHEAPGNAEGTEPEYPRDVAAFVERFAADLNAAGLQRMPSRVFACLLASEDGALSSAQLAERLRISPAAVSGAVRYLSQVHMISRERLPGSRREQYRVDQDVWYRSFTNRDQMYRRWEQTLQSGIEAVGPTTMAAERLAETAAFMAFLEEQMAQLLDRWHAHRSVSGRPLESGSP
ncbi:GbsR/MarR family transcriptional regulator [Streptomyces sp. NBRC 109706]|uniref:GbsR/MarR family transcriptional regulator n=1 Tax=Streptomyces sp. NBRC 109706 TaxID=1550035 RepID=UPI000837731D|nr:MarR family transcriptional regulator [Streptomyces sp. NBRC 109706]